MAAASSRKTPLSPSSSCEQEKISTHHLFHRGQRRRGLLRGPTILTPVARPLDGDLVHDYNVLALPPRRQDPADRIEYLLRFFTHIPIDLVGFFVGALESGCGAGVEGRCGEVWRGRRD